MCSHKHTPRCFPLSICLWGNLVALKYLSPCVLRPLLHFPELVTLTTHVQGSNSIIKWQSHTTHKDPRVALAQTMTRYGKKKKQHLATFSLCHCFLTFISPKIYWTFPPTFLYQLFGSPRCMNWISITAVLFLTIKVVPLRMYSSKVQFCFLVNVQ